MKILLVEDDKALSKALVNIFINNNYEVCIAVDGLEGLNYLNNGYFDIVVLDILMPRLNGFEFIKKARALKKNQPILVLSALSDVTDKVTGLNLGADDYLTKPFEIKELIARIEALARRNSNINHEVISFNETNLDISTYQLSYKDKTINLTFKEVEILKKLFINHDIIVSTINLFSEIWSESTTDFNVVWVNISNLRKKLALIEASVSIKVVRGVGYMLEKNND